MTLAWFMGSKIPLRRTAAHLRGQRSQGAEGAAWRRMAGHVPAETLSRLLWLPYLTVAMLLVNAAITLFAQLSRRRQGRSRELSQRLIEIAE